MATDTPTAPANGKRTTRFPLFRRRQCLVPTWRGWLLFLVLVAALAWCFVRNAYSFLAQTAPMPGGVLVVEGWSTDFTMQAVVDEFNRGGYSKVFVIGGNVEHGSHLARYGSFAALGKAVLIALGMKADDIVAVPAPFVPQDRTYTALKYLRIYFDEHGGVPKRVHLFSEGAHARRSHLLLEMVMPKGTEVGVASVPSQSFDVEHWWRTSAGFKSVLGEWLSYFYTRVLFRPA